MSKLEWDLAAERFYETGVSKGVLWVYANGVPGTATAWNGLTSVNENPEGAEISTFYADNIEYVHVSSVEKLGLTIECFTYPDEFKPCIGEVEGATGVTFTAQKHQAFDFSYRNEVGSEEDEDAGYKLHIVYGCKAQPSSIDRPTINDSPDLNSFSFDCVTSPVTADGLNPTAHVIIDSRKVGGPSATAQTRKAIMDALEARIYDNTKVTPSIAEIAEIIYDNSVSG